MGDTGASWPPGRLPHQNGASVVGGRYELRDRIGSGGMASVYDGRDTVLDRPVAVKVLHQHLADKSTWRTRFEAEARMAARLTHPNVVQVYDTGVDAGVPFIVMERLPGETLDDHRGERIDQGRVREWIVELLGALSAAHAIGLVHRDIKPGNVLLTASGTAKLGDFGIAKSVEGDALTDTGQVIGTVGYLSPERLRGERGDERSDVYALALVMWEAAAGRKAFEGTSPGAVIDQVMHHPPPPLTSVVPGADPQLSAVLARGMSADPATRYATADAMLADLTSGAVPAAPPVPGATGVMAAADATRMAPAAEGHTSVLPRPEPVATRGAPPPPPGRSSTWGWWVAALLLLIAAGIVLAVVAGNRNSKNPADTTTSSTSTTAPPSTTSAPTTTASTTTTTEATTTTTEAPATTITVLPTTTESTSTTAPPTTTTKKNGILPGA